MFLMCDESYEEKILARQESEAEMLDPLEECLEDFPINSNEWEIQDAFVAGAVRDRLWNLENVSPLTVEQFVACVNHSDRRNYEGLSVYNGFENLNEVLGYIVYLERTLMDCQDTLKEIKSATARIRELCEQ